MKIDHAPKNSTIHLAYLLLGLVWILFLFSALEQRQLPWFNLLFLVRILESGMAFLLFALSFRYPTGRLLPLYLTFCAAAQSVFSVLEGPFQLEYFQYIPYFTLLNVLAFDGEFKSWIKRHGLIHFFAIILALFTKDAQYFESIGKFVFQFTTPVAIVVLSLLVLRIVSEKHRAIRSSLELKSELLIATEKLNSRLDEELNRAKEKLLEGERNRILTQLALEVSHDIRSPVAALETLEKQLPTEFPESHRELLKHALDRIQYITNQLLDSNRAQTRTLMLLKEGTSSKTFDSESSLDQLLRGLIAEKRLEYSKLEGIQFAFESTVDTSSIQITLPSTELSRIVSNLINNSVEALNGHGVIRTTINRASSSQLEIAVSDNGKGMPPEVLSAVRKGPHSHGKAKGSGIGLQHARSRLESANGKLSIDSEPGNGTRVTLSLPVLQK